MLRFVNGAFANPDSAVRQHDGKNNTVCECMSYHNVEEAAQNKAIITYIMYISNQQCDKHNVIIVDARPLELCFQMLPAPAAPSLLSIW